MFDKFKEECGVFGISKHEEASRLIYLGLHALQHRGQESAGICTDDVKLRVHHVMGRVAESFDANVLEALSGTAGIGHVRYSTAGASLLRNAQPFMINYAYGQLAVAHNGNLVNAGNIKKRLENGGSIFRTTMDTEVIMHLIARSLASTLEDKIVDALIQIDGAYSLLFLEHGKMIGVRDPHGFRPLVLGKVGDGWVLSSETTALSLIDGQYVRDVKPGEMIIIEGDKMRSIQALEPSKKRSRCIFEYVYFARPDSLLFGENVYLIRKEMGRQLARESHVDADLVIPVPDSGVPAAIGYAEEAKIPFEMGLIRSHYVGRTFIEPSQSIRHFGVKLKLLPVKRILRGKRVVVIDDSIVRSTTARKIVQMVREAGAAEVHVRISSPPTMSPCYYGIDTPTKKELIASSHSVDEIKKRLTATTLAYLSLEGMIESTGQEGNSFCHACFSGEYPIKFPDAEE